jgi:excisionase family DNA binding protein
VSNATLESPLSVSEVAELERLHPKTVLRYIREGKLRGHFRGNRYAVYPSELAAWRERTAVLEDAMPRITKERSERQES